MFASYRRRWVYARPIGHLLKFFAICMYAGLFNYRYGSFLFMGQHTCRSQYKKLAVSSLIISIDLDGKTYLIHVKMLSSLRGYCYDLFLRLPQISLIGAMFFVMAIVSWLPRMYRVSISCLNHIQWPTSTKLSFCKERENNMINWNGRHSIEYQF